LTENNGHETEKLRKQAVVQAADKAGEILVNTRSVALHPKRECLLARRPTDLVFISALGTDLFSLGDRPHHAAVNSERRAGSGACGFSAEINN
jgi:hypothetical protein